MNATMGDIQQVEESLGKKGELREIVRKLSPWKAGVQWALPNKLLRIIVNLHGFTGKREGLV